jgi:hypothetical protein
MYIWQDAGAEASPWYTDAALAARDALRDHPKVVEALDAAWQAVMAATERGAFGTLLREDYLTMSRKIYLATKRMDGAGDSAHPQRPCDMTSPIDLTSPPRPASPQRCAVARCAACVWRLVSPSSLFAAL